MDATLETVHRYGTTEPLVNGKMKFFGPVSERTAKNAIQEEINQFHKG